MQMKRSLSDNDSGIIQYTYCDGARGNIDEEDTKEEFQRNERKVEENGKEMSKGTDAAVAHASPSSSLSMCML